MLRFATIWPVEFLSFSFRFEQIRTPVAAVLADRQDDLPVDDFHYDVAFRDWKACRNLDLDDFAHALINAPEFLFDATEHRSHNALFREFLEQFLPLDLLVVSMKRQIYGRAMYERQQNREFAN